MASQYFSQDTLDFLSQLSANNNRDWFNDNKPRYEQHVRTPALRFIEDIAPALQLISPRFQARAKKVGGSLMRVYRDTRFSKDKTPYKTNIGIQFRHDAGKDVHAPGYYLHIEPDNFFLGVGIWRPDSRTLGKIRDAIDEKPEKWIAVRNDPAFTRRFTLSGESLKNAPRGFAKDHPLLEDLKHKDFIGICEFKKKSALSNNILSYSIEQFEQATPFMRFLCEAIEVGFD